MTSFFITSRFVKKICEQGNCHVIFIPVFFFPVFFCFFFNFCVFAFMGHSGVQKTNLDFLIVSFNSHKNNCFLLFIASVRDKTETICGQKIFVWTSKKDLIPGFKSRKNFDLLVYIQLKNGLFSKTFYSYHWPITYISNFLHLYNLIINKISDRYVHIILEVLKNKVVI